MRGSPLLQPSLLTRRSLKLKISLQCLTARDRNSYSTSFMGVHFLWNDIYSHLFTTSTSFTTFAA